jgi:sterol desaturase/sphingolipid hydroxylase (fatty acid hydroxylase superfamily)
MLDGELFSTIQNILANSWVEVKVAMMVYGVGLAIEYFRPAENNQPVRDILFNLVYTVIFVFVSAFLIRSTSWIIAPVVGWAGGPLLQFELGDGVAWELLYAISFFVIFDFFYYWFHRFQHKSRILWAQHKFHHSEPSLNVTSGNRHHWLEGWMRIFLILIPMQFLIELKPGSLGLIWSTFLLWGYFIHMNIKLNLGPLTPLLAGPQLHRIHHSNLPQHQDKNFAAFFPVYDIVFGSYWKPAPDEYPRTGLSSGQNMNNLRDANFGVFMDWADMLRSRKKRLAGQG